MPRAGEMPILVEINGNPFWQAGGRTFPVVAGGEDPPGDGKNEDGKPADPPKKADGDGSSDDGDFDKDRALATIRKLRENEKATKTQLKELETLRTKVKEHDDAQKSEAEKLAARVKELEDSITEKDRSLTEERNHQAIERAATKAGTVDAEDVFRLLDPKEFELDDKGQLTNADDLVKALLKAKPYLAARVGANGVPATPRSNGTQSHEDRVKENLGKLKASGLYDPL